MKRKHHARPAPEGPPRAVTPVGQDVASPAGLAYPRARDAADIIGRARGDLARLLRGAARPLAGAAAAGLVFGAMMGGCMPVVRPEAMPEQSPASEMLDEQGSAGAQSAGQSPPATTNEAGASPAEAR